MNKTMLWNGQPVFYRKTGEGKPVMLLHGFAEDGEVWNKQAACLEKKYTLIIPDLPGSGSSALTKDISMESMADIIQCILVEEKMMRTVMIGHSMGGYITLAFAEKYPGMLNGMALFHSTAYADSEEKKASRRKSIAFIQSNGTYPFLQQAVPGLFSDVYKKENPSAVTGFISRYSNFIQASLVAYCEAMINRPGRTNVLSGCLKPVLFIIGEHDNAVPVQDSLQQSHLPTKSYIHILGNSGHMGMLEEPDKCNQILEKFLQDAC